MVFMVTVFFSAGAWLDATLYKYFVENMLMDYYLVFLSLAVGILIFTSFSGIIPQYLTLNLDSKMIS